MTAQEKKLLRETQKAWREYRRWQYQQNKINENKLE